MTELTLRNPAHSRRFPALALQDAISETVRRRLGRKILVYPENVGLPTIHGRQEDDEVSARWAAQTV